MIERRVHSQNDLPCLFITFFFSSQFNSGRVFTFALLVLLIRYDQSAVECHCCLAWKWELSVTPKYLWLFFLVASIFFFREWETEKMKKWVVILVHSENMNRSGFFLCAHKVTCSHAHQFAFLLCHPLERPGMRLFCLISWKCFFFSLFLWRHGKK